LFTTLYARETLCEFAFMQRLLSCLLTFVSLTGTVTREQHKAILAFFDDVAGGAQPPMDVEADAIIRAMFVRNPDAAYRITMLAMALSQPPAAAPAAAQPARRSWLSGLFERREHAVS
jgi:hypothetical protein